MRTLFTFLAVAALCLVANAQTETINLNASVFFASASHEPDAAELAKLTTFAGQLTSYADYTLRVEAFTDEQGTDAYNEALAQRRAAAITRALAQNAVTPTTSVVLTHGEQQARLNTTDDAERQNDRRVDLVATVVRWTDAEAAINAARATQYQTLNITDPTARQTIRGREGGTFLLEANSLVRADGTPAVGPVSVELIEAYGMADMLLAGLTTTSGDRRLTTGGMLKLTATDADGAALALTPGKMISASIPTNDYNPEMQIFAGTDHGADGVPNDWTLTTGGVSSSLEELFGEVDDPEPMMEDIQASVAEEVSLILSGKKVRTGHRIKESKMGLAIHNWTSKNPEPKEPNYYDPNRNYITPKPEMVDTSTIFYEPAGMDKVLMSKSKRTAKTAAARTSQVRVYDRRLERHEKSVIFQANVPSANRQMKQSYEGLLAEWKAKREEFRMSLMSDETRRRYQEIKARREAMMAARAARIREMGEKLAGMKDLSGQNKELDRYFFSIGELGWANCDMFGRNPDPIEVFAQLPYSTEQAKVMLLPNDRRSVVSFKSGGNGQWRCSGIPRNVGYHVIAYQVMNGQMVMAHRFISRATSDVTDLKYQPVAVADLKDKLADILGS